MQNNSDVGLENDLRIGDRHQLAILKPQRSIHILVEVVCKGEAPIHFSIIAINATFGNLRHT